MRLLSIYQLNVRVNHFQNLLLNEIMWPKSEHPQKIYFYTFSNIKMYYICQNLRLFCLIICLKLLSCTDLSGNTIYEVKVCLNIGRAFKLCEILVLINLYDKCLQKPKNEVLIFLSIFVFQEKDHSSIFVMTPCIICFNITEFMQSKLNEMQLFSFREN